MLTSANIEPIDKSTILSNILDNAIEACQKLSSDKFIVVEIKIGVEKVKIAMQNSAPYTDVKNNIIRTTKSDKNYHGISLDSVNATLQNIMG